MDTVAASEVLEVGGSSERVVQVVAAGAREGLVDALMVFAWRDAGGDDGLCGAKGGVNRLPEDAVRCDAAFAGWAVMGLFSGGRKERRGSRRRELDE